MMCPDPCARMTGSTACVTQSAPKRLVSICACESASLTSSIVPKTPYPALSIATSMRPKRSRACARRDGAAIRATECQIVVSIC